MRECAFGKKTLSGVYGEEEKELWRTVRLKCQVPLDSGTTKIRTIEDLEIFSLEVLDENSRV